MNDDKEFWRVTANLCALTGIGLLIAPAICMFWWQMMTLVYLPVMWLVACVVFFLGFVAYDISEEQ